MAVITDVMARLRETVRGRSRYRWDVVPVANLPSGGASPPFAISDTAGLETELDAKAPTVHTQAISTVTGLQAALDDIDPAAVYAVEVVLDHAGIQALTSLLELIPAEAGVAFVVQEFSVSHPEWPDGYDMSPSPNGLALSGVQALEAQSTVFDWMAVAAVIPRTAEELDVINDIGQALTAVVSIPSGVISTLGNIVGTPPSGTGGGGGLTPSGGSGTGASFTVTYTAGVYSVEITAPGQNYQAEDILTVLGTYILLPDEETPGLTPDNDVSFEVTAVEDGSLSGGHVDNELRIAVLYTKKSL